MNYGRRGGKYLSEGGGDKRNAYGNMTAPAHGYIWDACHARGQHRPQLRRVRPSGRGRRGRRSAERAGGSQRSRARGAHQPDLSAWNLAIPDNKRIDAWLKEFRGVREERRPAALSNIHPPGQRPHGRHARRGPDAARDDRGERPRRSGGSSKRSRTAATGRTPRSSSSRTTRRTGRTTWTRTARVALVISPYTRRGAWTARSTRPSMLRTIELILGLPPMSQYDAAATPMYAAFTPQPDAEAVLGAAGPRVARRDEHPAAYGAQASARDELR